MQQAEQDQEQEVKQCQVTVDCGRKRLETQQSDVLSELGRFALPTSCTLEQLSSLQGEAFTHERFDALHGGHKRTRRTGYQKFTQRLERLRCTSACVTQSLLRLFPVCNTLRSYRLPNDLVHDVVGGLTVCVMHIPQGMAYGMLAGLPPVYGLYSSLFPVAVYFLFGSSNHVSFGTNSITSLMVSSAISRLLSADLPSFIVVAQASPTASQSTTPSPTVSSASTYSGVIEQVTTATMSIQYSGNSSGGCKSHLSEAALAEDSLVLIDGRVASLAELRIEIAIAITLLVGLLQIAMSVLRLGFLTVYLSDSLVSGFTTASAIHVVTSQLSDMIGYKTRQYSGPFNLIYKYIDMGRNITKFNAINFAMAVMCIMVLLVVKEKLQPLVNKRYSFPIPIDLVLIVLSTLCSYLASFKSYGVGIVGYVPAGIPAPRLPDVRFFPPILSDCLLIAILSYATTITMAKTLALKHSYEVHGNQELLAVGMSNALGGCCNCMCTSASMSRSLIQQSAGCRSQVSSLVSCTGILLVLLFIAPLFQSVPRCVLASIIVVALKGLLLQFADLRSLWHTSSYDFAIWLVTFSATVLLDVDLGLMAGFVFSIFTIMIRTQKPYVATLGLLPGTSLYKDRLAYADLVELAGIKIVRFDGPLYFASKAHFRSSVSRMTGVNVLAESRRRRAPTQDSRLPVATAGSLAIDKGETGTSHSSEITVSFYLSDSSNCTSRTTSESTYAESVNNGETHVAVQLGVDCHESELLHGKSESTNKADKESQEGERATHVIVDCSSVTFVDACGIRALAQTIDDYASIGVSVFICGPHDSFREMLEKTDFFKKHSRQLVFVTTHDAVLEALKQREEIWIVTGKQ